MTLEEIQLMVIKKVSEIAEAVPQPSGKFFYYDGSGVLKKAPMTEIYNLVSGSQSLGTITTASTIPAEGNVWGFAAPGTYPNAGNLTVAENTLGILTRVGTTWSKLEVALQKGADGKTIEDWSAKAFTAGSNVFYGGKIYTNTANTLSTDVPGTASVWVEKDIRSTGLDYTLSSKNILNPKHYLESKMVHPDTGLPFDSAYLNMWKDVPVEGGKDYAFTDIYGIAWFDAQDNLIKYETAEATLKAPANAVKASFDANKSQSATAQVELGTSRTSYEPFKQEVVIHNLNMDFLKDYIKEEDLKVVHDIFPVGRNLINPDIAIVGKFLNPDTKQPFDASWAKLFPYVPVKPNTNYSISGYYQILYHDINKQPIGNVFSPATHFTTPSDAVFLSVDANVENNVMMVEGTEFPVIYEPFVGIEGTKIENLFLELLRKNGKKITIGDATTNELIVNNTRVYYQKPEQGIFFGGGAGGDVIPDVQANVAWGTKALSSVTTGGSNTAFGHYALKSLTTGWDNTAFGSGALESFQDGIGNQAMGRLALSKLVNGGHNTALTDSALEKMESGDDNTAVGYGSGTRIIVGNRNTIYGVYASGWKDGANASQQTNYDDTVAFGAFILNFNTSGSKNTAGGNYSMYQLTGESNAAWGYYTLYDAKNCNNNAAFGNFAGQKLQNGNNNVFIGHLAGGVAGQKIDASNSIAVGYGAVTTKNNQIVLGNSTNDEVVIAGVTFTKAQLHALKNLVS